MNFAEQHTRTAVRTALALLYGARAAPLAVAMHLLVELNNTRSSTALELFTDLHIQDAFLQKADRILQRCDELAISAVAIGDPLYPSFLRSIPAPPPVLFMRGDLNLMSKLPGVAVVGSRDATMHGLEIARRISSFLAARGWPIVSGLALGIDAAAHRGALEAKGKTIAVLANGLHKATPAQNAKLADEILDSGGLWIAEHAPDIPAQKGYFVQRNRIQAGLSAGSIIVEGKKESGSMTQAQFCLLQKRQLFAVVPNGANVTVVSEGPQMLVDDYGAFPIRSLSDYQAVVDALERSKGVLV